MKTQKVTSSVSIAHSLCGITPANSRLEIPKVMDKYELRILCAELENALKEGADCSLECPVCAPPPVGPWLGKAPPPPAAPAPTGCGGVGDDPCSPSPPPALLSDLLGIAFE